MQPTTERELCLQELANHRAAVEAFVDRAQAVSAPAWDTPRAPGKWTPAQEAVHLVLTYRGYAAEVREGPDVTPETFPARSPALRTEILPRILAGNWFPSGAVSPAVARPDDAPREKHETLAELVRQARDFESAVVDAVRHNHARCVRHPYLGALSVVELVVVLTEHTKHHMKNLSGRSC